MEHRASHLGYGFSLLEGDDNNDDEENDDDDDRDIKNINTFLSRHRG
jgi:hypothetical protein